MKHSGVSLKALILAGSIFLLAATTAQAGVPFLVGYGDEVSQIFDLPDDKFGKVNVGYFYSYVSVFFIPIVTWSGKLVLFEENKYQELVEEDLKELEATFGKMRPRVGWWVSYVNFLWIILVPLLIFLGKRGAEDA